MNVKCEIKIYLLLFAKEGIIKFKKKIKKKMRKFN